MKKVFIIGAIVLTFGLTALQPANAEASTGDNTTETTNFVEDAVGKFKTATSSFVGDVLDSFKKLVDKAIESATKSWKVKFNVEMDPSTFNSDNVYVVDDAGNRLTTIIKYKEGTKEGIVYAPTSGYEKGKKYTLVITDRVKSKDGKPLAQGVTMKFELTDEKAKSVHELSKKEMEAWIDREADLKRLNGYPIKDDFFDTVAESNYLELHPWEGVTRVDWTTKNMFNPTVGFMDTYFNRDYRNIGDEFIKKIRYYYRTGFEYNGQEYKYSELPKMFQRFVQETKNEKRISESIFVSDLSMVYSLQRGYDVQDRVRGTQYIRYTSGTNLPKGVALNKWYKRDVDVRIFNPGIPSNKLWDTAVYVFYDIYPITSYKEVKN